MKNTSSTSDLILFGKYASLAEIKIIQSYLESEDIKTYLFDQHANSMAMVPTTSEGIRLMIAKEDLQKAQTLIEAQKLEAINNDDLIGTDCPKCKSNNTKILFNEKNIDVSGLLLSFVVGFPFVKKFKKKENWICTSCHNEWEEIPKTSGLDLLTLFIQILIWTIIGVCLYYYFT